MTSVDVGGLQLEYDVHGSGDPVVLIMGLGTQMIAWTQPFIDRLVSHGHQVIRFDNRDIGMSSKTTGPVPAPQDLVKAMLSRRLAKAPYTLADMAGDVVGLLDALGIDRAHLVGASMGGMIAQEVAIGHPERVRSLTSIMSTTGNRLVGRVAPSLVPALRSTMLAPMPTDRQARIERGVATYRAIGGPHFNEPAVRELMTASADRDSDPNGRLRQLMAINASPDRTAGLHRLHLPTLVVHGLLDRLVQPSGGLATTKAIAGSRLLMFPDMAHDLPIPRLDEIADAVAENARRG